MARKKTSMFIPIDDSGKLIQECQSVEDLDGFVLWLNDSGSAEMRKMAYSIEHGAEVVPTGPNELGRAKASLIEKACGNFFKSWIKDINEKARVENIEGMDDAPFSKKNSMELVKSRKILRGMLSSMKEEMFGSAMAAASLNEEAVKDLMSTLQKDSRGFAALAEILSLKFDEQMKERMAQWMASQECRAAVKRSRQETIEVRRPLWGDFAPLIEHMVDKLGPQESAELVGRFDAYINSGWAAHDMDLSNRGGEKLRALRQSMLLLVKDPKKADMEGMRVAMEDRFKELFKAIKIDGGHSKSKSSDDYVATLVDQPAYEDGKAGSGMLDWAIRSVDGSRLLIGFATSDQFIQKQDDQWFRHMWGVKNSIKTGAGGFSDAGIGPKTVLEVSAVAPAALTTIAGSAIKEMFAAQLPSQAIQRINTLGFLYALTHGGKQSECSEVEFKVVGGRCSEWEAARQQANAFDEPERSQMISRAYCKIVADTLKDIKKVGWGHEKMDASISNIKVGGVSLIKWIVHTSKVSRRMAKEDSSGECSKILAGAADSMSYFAAPFLEAASESDNNVELALAVAMTAQLWKNDFPSMKAKKPPKKKKHKS